MANDSTARDVDRVWELMKMISYVKMAAAVVTGTRPNLGDNRTVAM
ncbi:hypothetical protein [Bradyrhizobium sp.]